MCSPMQLRTALATLPTPLWRGRNCLGSLPAWISETRNSATLCPMAKVSLSKGENVPASLGSSVLTIPMILSGRTLMKGSPMRSLGE